MSGKKFIASKSSFAKSVGVYMLGGTTSGGEHVLELGSFASD